MNPTIQNHQTYKLLNFLHKKTTLFSSQHLFQIHAHLITTGFHAHQPLLLSLLHLYASNPSTLYHATLISHLIHRPVIPTWQFMIRKHASANTPHEALSLFRSLQRREETRLLDPFIFASLIKACCRLMAVREGKSVHCQVLKSGLENTLNVQNTLIHFYSTSTNCMTRACNIFDRASERSIVTVNCMISGLFKNKLFDVGLSFFSRLMDGSLGTGLKPNEVTLVILISGCAELGNLGIGKSLHSYCCKTIIGLGSSVYNALIDLYAKFGSLVHSAKLFEEIPERDIVSWNAMIAGYCKNNEFEKALSLFREMMSKNVGGDGVTLISLISACGHNKDLDMGKWVHTYMKSREMKITVPIATALINMYSKCGSIEAARAIFDEMPKRNIISWNSMIMGYVECGCYTEALYLFDLIQSEHLEPDEVTMLGLISACRYSGEINHGRQLHSYVETIGLSQRTVIGNALVDMYSKYGRMREAKGVFDKLWHRDVISWTSIIVGLAINGQGEEALVAFQKMQAEGVEPNGITFIGLLTACDHAGLVEEGQILYKVMSNEYKIEPGLEHCGCMVDMLARAGLLEEAYEFVKSMKVEPNAVIWRMLIGSCRIHGEIDLGLSLVEGHLEQKRLREPQDYVISSNAFAEARRWDDVLHTRGLMLAQKIHKIPGQSSVSDVVE